MLSHDPAFGFHFIIKLNHKGTKAQSIELNFSALVPLWLVL